MNMFEEASAIKTMTSVVGVRREDVAKTLGISCSALTNKMRLLSLSEQERAIILENSLSERHARALLRLSEKEKRLEALEKICKMKLTVAESEAVIELLRSDSDTAPKTDSFPCPACEIDRLRTMIDEKIKALTALGIKIQRTESFYGRKSYINIMIEE